MDGNGRWALARGLPRLEGHRQGRESVRAVVRLAGQLGIQVLTLYVFSSENWRRPTEEVEGIMFMIEEVARGEIDELHANQVRLRVIGSLEPLPPSLREELRRDQELTAKNSGLTLNLAINYGGRAEIVQAIRSLVAEARRGQLHEDAVDEDLVAARLYTAGLPDPDLLIRTGNEMRLSNFLLWQCAYSEIYVTPVLWPDFREAAFIAALQEYGKRERRFGDVAPDSTF